MTTDALLVVIAATLIVVVVVLLARRTSKDGRVRDDDSDDDRAHADLTRRGNPEHSFEAPEPDAPEWSPPGRDPEARG